MTLLPFPFHLPSTRACLITLAALGATVATAGPDVASMLGDRSRLASIPRTTVRRADLESTVLSPGRVASSVNTEIRCQLERLDAAAGAASAGGASTILSLVDDGSIVKKGDLLCELDGSDYQELVRRQQIVVEQARTEHLQASLTLDVAMLALEAYREGEQAQVEQEYRGQIALARSDVERQTDRLAWTFKMLEKGYASAAQVATDKQTGLKLKESLREMEMSLANFRRFTAPKELMSLQKSIVGAQSTLNYQSIRLRREEERLAHYQKLADRCIIRAPHSGFVVLANRPGREPRVYLGAPVRERMPLFSLPDLSKMEVQLMLHETVVDKVREGMEADVQIDALPGRKLRGRVESINPMPLSDQNPDSANQIAYFVAHVKLDNIPAGLKPGMTAAASILCGVRKRALTLPIMAVAVEGGRQVCYVAHEDRFERRPVTVIPASHDLAEVTEGLSEGDQVVIDPLLLRSTGPR
jgi:HlyD family secretion protein